MYIVRTFNPCFKNVSNTIISVQNLKDLKNKVTFANIVFMSSGQYSPDIDVINLELEHLEPICIKVWSLCERSTTVEVRAGGGGSRTIHPMYISSIGPLIKKKS
jgi:hypothetical protein